MDFLDHVIKIESSAINQQLSEKVNLKGQRTAIHRSSSSLWQPRAGTAACDWLEDSLHRVVKEKKMFCVSKAVAKWRQRSYGSAERSGVKERVRHSPGHPLVVTLCCIF